MRVWGLARLRSAVAQFAVGRDEGTATVEFVLTLPVVLFTFLAAFESGIYMSRYILLDRALDITVRDLRLKLIKTPALASIKKRICAEVNIIDTCEAALRIRMFSVDTANWQFPNDGFKCEDRSEKINIDEPKLGVPGEMMLIQACLTADALFPTTGLAARMKQDAKGGYFVVASSAFVNEPS